jgi:hypothetical protein
MTALHLSRRHLLSAGGAALCAGVAGCSDATQSRNPPRDASEGPPADAVTDPETVSVRHDRAASFLELDRDDADFSGIIFLIDPADVDSLRFTTEPPGSDQLRRFTRRTDFESASVVVVQRRLGACYRRHTDYVIPREGSFDAEFCHVLRDADVRCEADDRQMVATAIRVPLAYDERPSRVSHGSGSHCESAFWEDTPEEGSG